MNHLITTRTEIKKKRKKTTHKVYFLTQTMKLKMIKFCGLNKVMSANSLSNNHFMQTIFEKQRNQFIVFKKIKTINYVLRDVYSTNDSFIKLLLAIKKKKPQEPHLHYTNDAYHNSKKSHT